MSINADFIVSEDGTLLKLAHSPAYQIYEGTPLTIDASTGQLRPAASADKVYGLCKIDSNQYRDFAFGEFGAFGSGCLTVVTAGKVEVSDSVYNEIEVNTSMENGPLPSSFAVTVPLFDHTQSYAAMDLLYVDGSGLITNVSGTNAIGKCLSPLAAMAAGALIMSVDPA